MSDAQLMENEYLEMMRELNKNGITAIDTFLVFQFNFSIIKNTILLPMEKLILKEELWKQY
jgi:hypothetical protein